jgi:hypothetical protein
VAGLSVNTVADIFDNVFLIREFFTLIGTVHCFSYCVRHIAVNVTVSGMFYFIEDRYFL